MSVGGAVRRGTMNRVAPVGHGVAGPQLDASLPGFVAGAIIGDLLREANDRRGAMRTHAFAVGPTDALQATVVLIDRVDRQPEGQHPGGAKIEVVVVLMRQRRVTRPRRLIEPFARVRLDRFPEQQVSVELPLVMIVRREVGGQVPIVPAVIAANGEFGFAGEGSRDADGDRHRFAAPPGEPRGLRPGMNLD